MAADVFLVLQDAIDGGIRPVVVTHVFNPSAVEFLSNTVRRSSFVGCEGEDGSNAFDLVSWSGHQDNSVRFDVLVFVQLENLLVVPVR